MAAKGQAKSGGRKKGTPNKSSIPLQSLAEELKVNPFEILLRFASGDWKSLGYEEEKKISYTNAGIEFEEYMITPELRVTAAKAACEYLHPKRKAIEIDEKSSNKLPKVVVLWADEDGNADAQAPETDAASETN